MKTIKFPYTNRNKKGNPNFKGWPKGRKNPGNLRALRELWEKRRQRIVGAVQNLKVDEALEVRSVVRNNEVKRLIKERLKEEDFIFFQEIIQGKTVWFVRKKQEGEED